jgi:pSer/pThr/pTyr-binding forkhead associated (FHA) protein
MQASAYLFMVNVPQDEWSGAVVRSEQIIGRDKDVPIVIPDRFRAVSRHHGAIWADASDQVFIRDLGSRCGTNVNGIHLKPE